MLKIVRSQRTAAAIFGQGKSTDPINIGTAGASALAFYLSNNATTGTARGMYLRLYVPNGAGGEALRAFTTVSSNTPADTVNGAHVSLNFGASAGNVTGLGTASRNTLHLASRNMTGTLAAIQAELYADGSNSTFTGTGSYIRAVVDGNATGVGKIDDTANLLQIAGHSIGAGNMVAAKSAAAISHTIRIKIDNTVYYLLASDTQ